MLFIFAPWITSLLLSNAVSDDAILAFRVCVVAYSLYSLNAGIPQSLGSRQYIRGLLGSTRDLSLPRMNQAGDQAQLHRLSGNAVTCCRSA